MHTRLGFPKSAILDQYWQQVAQEEAPPQDEQIEMEAGQGALFQAILEMCVEVCLRQGRAPENADFQKMLERGEELFEQAGGSSL